MNDVAILSKERYLETSNVSNLKIGTASNKALLNHSFCTQLQACRYLMEEHDKALSLLPTVAGQKISEALHDFYMAVARQCDAQTRVGRIEGHEDPLGSMSMADYMDYRTINAGGLMGFLRQTYLISLLDTSSSFTFPSSEEIEHVSYLVGKNVALVNDLYGLRKDRFSGEPNIILKYARERGCSDSSSNELGSFLSGPSISWALEVIKRTVRDIESYYEDHPDCLVTKHGIAFGCISGNYGFHDSSKRYELPVGFSWI